MKRWTDEELRLMEKLHAKKASYKEIYAAFPTRDKSCVRTKSLSLGYKIGGSKIKWSPEEENLMRELHAKGLTYKDMLEYFPAKSESSARSKAFMLGLTFAKTNKRLCASKEELQKLVDEGLSIKEISAKIGSHYRAIKKALTSYGIEYNYKMALDIQKQKEQIAENDESEEIKLLRNRELEMLEAIQKAIQKGDSISKLTTNLFILRAKLMRFDDSYYVVNKIQCLF